MTEREKTESAFQGILREVRQAKEKFFRENKRLPTCVKFGPEEARIVTCEITCQLMEGRARCCHVEKAVIHGLEGSGVTLLGMDIGEQGEPGITVSN